MASHHAKFAVSKVCAHEFDQQAAVAQPVLIQPILSLEQVARKIQGRPRAAIAGCVVIFEELREQRALVRGARDLVILDPSPQRQPRCREFTVAVLRE